MTKAELYRRFGPKLIDALTQVILDEINLLRSEIGLSSRTSQQVINAIVNKLENISDYEWMKSPFNNEEI